MPQAQAQVFYCQSQFYTNFMRNFRNDKIELFCREILKK